MDARERRQARIRASGADRLAKITGKPADNTQHDDPPDVLPVRDPVATHSTRSTILSSSTTPALDLSSFNSNFESALAEDNKFAHPDPNEIFANLPDTKFGTNEKSKQASPSASRKIHWPLIHFLVMIFVGMYSCWNQFQLWRVFAAAQIVLVSIRYAIDPSLEPTLLVSFLQYLPDLSKRLATPFFVVQALRGAYLDFCVVLFIFCVGRATLGH